MRTDAAAPENDNTSLDTGKSTSKQTPSKKELTLALVLMKGPVGITQPEAYSVYGESCLHTSISTLQNQHGIIFARKPDKSTIKHSGQRPFTRYWPADGLQADKCLKLLNHLRQKRGFCSTGGSSSRNETV